MTFLKTNKNIREFVFHKIIQLVVKDSFKYLGHMGEKNNQSVILLFIQSSFLKTGVSSASFSSLGKVP